MSYFEVTERDEESTGGLLCVVSTISFECTPEVSQKVGLLRMLVEAAEIFPETETIKIPGRGVDVLRGILTGRYDIGPAFTVPTKDELLFLDYWQLDEALMRNIRDYINLYNNFATIKPEIDMHSPLMTRELAERLVFSARYRGCFALLADNMKTPAMCTYAVREDWNMLVFVPDDLQTRAMALDTVHGHPSAIQYVCRRAMSPLEYADLCAWAVDAQPNVIAHVPEDVLDERMCLRAVMLSPFVVAVLPEESLTSAVVYTALRTGRRGVLRLLSPSKIDATAVEIAMDCGDFDAFRFIPSGLKTKAICMAVVAQTPLNLSWVPVDHPDYDEIATQAIRMDIMAFGCIPSERRSPVLVEVYQTERGHRSSWYLHHGIWMSNTRV
jgi:hypothetical protein